jgi:hypothetical protein
MGGLGMTSKLVEEAAEEAFVLIVRSLISFGFRYQHTSAMIAAGFAVVIRFNTSGSTLSANSSRPLCYLCVGVLRCGHRYQESAPCYSPKAN